MWGRALFQIDTGLRIGNCSVYPNAGKVEDAADPRRQGWGPAKTGTTPNPWPACHSNVRRPGNAVDTVSSDFPKGKQHGEYTMVLNLTICGILKQGIVGLQPPVFKDSDYAAVLFMQR